MQRRIYLPVTRQSLVSLRSGDGLTGSALIACAVTEELRRANSGADEEQLEYLAFLDATTLARGSRRMVAAADVEAEAPTEKVGEAGSALEMASAVRILGPVSLRAVASFHLQESPRAGVSDDGDFLWYDVTEIDSLVDLLS